VVEQGSCFAVKRKVVSHWSEEEAWHQGGGCRAKGCVPCGKDRDWLDAQISEMAPDSGEIAGSPLKPQSHKKRLAGDPLRVQVMMHEEGKMGDEEDRSMEEVIEDGVVLS
ncbi:9657_t:CDS:2, partial [Acaulospora colombiana]